MIRLVNRVSSAVRVGAGLLLALLLPVPLPAAKLNLIGLRSVSQKELLDHTAGRMKYILNRPATPSRADDAAFHIQQHLKLHGLPNASVEWSLPGNDTILLKIDEGSASFIGPIQITGNSPISRKEVLEHFLAPSRDQFSEEKKQALPYRADSIKEGESRTQQKLHSIGYWDARVSSVQGKSDSIGNIPLVIQITAGSLHRLAPPKIVSPVPLIPKTLEKINRLTNEPATTVNINTQRRTVLEHFRHQGYHKAEVSLSQKKSAGSTTLTYTISPGKQHTLRKVHLMGLEKTNAQRISKRFANLLNQPIELDTVYDRVQSISSTGAFENITLSEQILANNEIDLTLHLKETKAKGVSFSTGFGTYEGFIFGARYHDRNWLGQLWNLNTGFEYNGLGLLGEVSVTDPFFLDRDLRFTPRAYLITRDFDGYNKLQGGIGAELSWKANEFYRLTLGLENSFTSTQPDGLPSSALGPTNYLVTRLNFNQRYDRRNDPALPTDGYFLQMENSLGLALGDGSISFFEADFHGSYYKTLSKESALNLGFRTGFIIPTGDSSDLPIDLRKFIGGANTVRSFKERELGPLINGNPTGGNAWWVANAEYIRAIKGPLKGVFFLDAGALASDYDQLFSAEVKAAAGLGLRLDLPIGPVRLEYGRALNPADGDPSGSFHFAIGTTF